MFASQYIIPGSCSQAGILTILNRMTRGLSARDRSRNGGRTQAKTPAPHGRFFLVGLQIAIQNACLMEDSLVGRPIPAAAAFPRAAKPAAGRVARPTNSENRSLARQAQKLSAIGPLAGDGFCCYP